MAPRILLFGLIVAGGLTSCATYRTGQTPDDVYYSPAREVNSYVQVDRDEDNRLSYNDRNLEDRRLRQQIRDPRFRFDDNIYWNSPRYNSWGWNTWNNPYNTWGWNNTWGMNDGWGWNSGYYNPYGGYKGWNSNYICIPGAYNVIVISGPGAPKNSTGVRYAAPIQRFTNAGTNFNTKGAEGSGSRYFNGNSNGTRRGLFGGGNTNSWNSENSGNNSRNFGNSNSSSNTNSGGSRTFNNSGSSNSSSSGSSGSSGSKTTTTPSRRN